MNIIISNSIHDFCRVCLQSSGPLFPCHTKLFFNEISSTIIEVLKTLTPQNVNDPPHYPISICFTCKEFVQSTFVLKTTFEKTNILLKSLFADYEKKQQEKTNTTYIDVSSTEDEDSVKSENNSVTNNVTYPSSLDDNQEEHIHKETDITIKIENEGTNKSFAESLSSIDDADDDDDNDYDNEDIDDMDCSNNSNEGSVNSLYVENKKRNVAEVPILKNVGRKRKVKGKLKLNYSSNLKNDIVSGTVPKHLRANINFPFNRTSMKLEGKPLFEQDYLCPICQKELPNPDELKKHARAHKILRKYFSKTRKKFSRNVKFIAQPRETYATSKKDTFLYVCPFCKLNLTIEKFQDHVNTHFSQGDFACNQCDRVFRKLGHLNSHITVVHKEELPYQCYQCDKGFTVKYSYDCHLLTHQTLPEELPHKCECCDKAFANKLFLKRHMFTHNNENKSARLLKKCKICLRTFETFEELQEHKAASSCEPVTVSLKYLPRKYCNEQGISKPPLPKELCALCGASVVNLYQHMRKTHGPKDAAQPVKELCTLCGARVICMKQHMKSHGPKNPVECHICHKKLSSRITLVKHIRVHTGERPYPCKYCDKRFKDLHTKSVHERTHDGVRKHICPICEKGFLEKSYMLKHMRGVHK